MQKILMMFLPIMPFIIFVPAEGTVPENLIKYSTQMKNDRSISILLELRSANDPLFVRRRVRRRPDEYYEPELFDVKTRYRGLPDSSEEQYNPRKLDNSKIQDRSDPLLVTNRRLERERLRDEKRKWGRKNGSKYQFEKPVNTSSYGKNKLGKRPESSETKLHSKLEQANVQKRTKGDKVRFEELKPTTEPPTSFFGNLLNSVGLSSPFGQLFRGRKNPEPAKTDKPARPSLRKRPVEVGRSKSPGKPVGLEPQTRNSEKGVGRRRFQNKRVDIDEPPKSEVINPPPILKKYKLVDIMARSYDFNEPYKSERNGLIREKIFKKLDKVDEQKQTRRLNNDNEIRGYGRGRNVGSRPLREQVRGINVSRRNNALKNKPLNDRQLHSDRENIIGEDYLEEKEEIFDKRKQNRLPHGRADGQSVYGKRNPLAYRQRVAVRKNTDEDKSKTEVDENNEGRVVLIIPVPKGMGEQMKKYDGIMKFLSTLFPKVFPPA